MGEEGGLTLSTIMDPWLTIHGSGALELYGDMEVSPLIEAMDVW